MTQADRLPNALAPTSPVSRESRYCDTTWQLARNLAGYHDRCFRVDWGFGMPDGTSFADRKWDELREAAKAFLWSLHCDPPEGREAIALRALPALFPTLRVIIMWMVDDGIARFSEIDAAAHDRLLLTLTMRRGRSGGTLKRSTLGIYLSLLRAFYLQREKLPDAPAVPPSMVGARRVTQLPYTPDQLAIPLVAAALDIIGSPADAIIALRDGAHARYREGLAHGVTLPAAQERARRWLEQQRPDALSEISFKAPPTTEIKRLNYLIARLTDACFVVIAYLVGARASEILSLEAGCIAWSELEKGQERFAYLVGTIRKGAAGQDGVPHRWVAPEPVQRAVAIMEELSSPFRAPGERPLLWISAKATVGAIAPLSRIGRPITVDLMNDRLNDHFAPFVGMPPHEGAIWRLSTHQGRKTFARFVGRRDRTGLAALRKHLGHVTRAMTDRSYVGTDFELSALVDQQAAQETRAALEELLTAPGLAGKAGRELAARSPFRGRTKAGDLGAYITDILAQTDMRLGVCDWGYCLYRRETSACLGGDREPNPILRTQSTCVNCANFVVSPRHRPVWESRLARNKTLLQRLDLDPESMALAETRIAECVSILNALDADLSDDPR